MSLLFNGSLLGIFLSALLLVTCGLNLSNIWDNLLLQGLCKKFIQAWIGIIADFGRVGTFSDVFNCGWLFTIKANLNHAGSWGFWDQLLFNCVVVILNDLNFELELVDLSLIELLSVLSQQVKVKFDVSSLHDLLSELDGLLLSLLDNLPELVRKDISALMELFFGLVVFSEIWVLI